MSPHRSRPMQHPSHGWSILEVMIALVVLAIGILACLNSTTITSLHFIKLRDHTIATMLAHNKFAELRHQATILPLEQLAKQGTILWQQRLWRWQWHWQSTQHRHLFHILFSIQAQNDGSSIEQYTCYLYAHTPE